MATRPFGALLICMLSLAPAVRAQETPLDRHDLPRRVYERLRTLVDDDATTRFDGPTRIVAGRTVSGDVVAYGGPFTLTGRIGGDLVVIDGDLVLEPGGEVGGDVTVVGGTAEGVEAATIRGTLTVYGEGFDADDDSGSRTRRDRRGYDPPWDDDWWDDDDTWRSGTDAYSRIVVRPGPSYNRVEGLPIRLGPEARTAGPNPLRVRALGILRTENGAGFDRDDIGYSVRAEQFVGGRRTLRIGGAAYSVVEPIEAWSLRNVEAGLATFVAHADPRDHYERTGWNAFVGLRPRTVPLDATVEFRSDEYDAARLHDPFTLFGDDPWRLQPLVATGTLRSIVGRLVVDDRDDDYFPTRGWYLEASVLRGLDGGLAVPAFVDAALIGPGASPRRSFGSDVTHAFVDVRRYERMPDALLGFRLVAGGSPTGEALPPQFQHALGGAGAMPGFGRFTLDCGARASTVTPIGGGGASYHPFYGCDRFVTFQAEYIGRFDIDMGWDDGDDEYDDGVWAGRWWGWRPDLAWVAFFDAGHGWSHLEDADDGLLSTDTGTSYDLGGGLLLGGIGLYAAVPLTGEDDDIRLFLRIGRRF